MILSHARLPIPTLPRTGISLTTRILLSDGGFVKGRTVVSSLCNHHPARLGMIGSILPIPFTGVNPYEWTAGKVNFSPMAVD